MANGQKKVALPRRGNRQDYWRQRRLSLTSRVHRELLLTLTRLAPWLHLTIPRPGWGRAAWELLHTPATRAPWENHDQSKGTNPVKVRMHLSGTQLFLWFPRECSLEKLLYQTHHRMFTAHCYKIKYCNIGSFNNIYTYSLLGDGYIGVFHTSLKDRMWWERLHIETRQSDSF